MGTERKDVFKDAKRILVKIGTGVLTGEDGLDGKIIQQLVDEMAELIKQGFQFVIVSSGAIAREYTE